MTVYMALCLTLVLSLYLVLIDGVRRNGAGLEAACAAEAGLQSIMAEYHRELLKQYNLFAIDSSYGTPVCGRKNTQEHLAQYIERNLSCEDVLLSNVLYRDFFGLRLDEAVLTGVSILTDGNGTVFRQRAIEAVKDDIGLHLLEQVREWMRVIEINGLDAPETTARREELSGKMDEYNGREVQISEEESVELEINNPIAALEGKSHLGILRLTVDEEEKLSENVLNSEGLIKNRMEQGNINLGNMEAPSADSLTDRFLFQEYLLRYMGHYGREGEEDAMKYQIEYLIAGNDSDIDNLRSVVNRICAIREAANAAYLLTDGEKWAEIQGAACAACGFIVLPWLIPVAETAILLGWAFAESIYDVRSMLSGGRIPLLKDRESWHYGLAAALSGELRDGTGEERGLSYEDYLRILMMFVDQDTLTSRAMNMVEADLRMTAGNGAFRLDACYDKLETSVAISSSYGYTFQIWRKRTY